MAVVAALVLFRVQKPPNPCTQMEEDLLRIQLQCIADEMREMRMRMERAERRVQMLTDSFVVAGLWRTSSSLEKWKRGKGLNSDNNNNNHLNNNEEDMLQFEMTTDD